MNNKSRNLIRELEEWQQQCDQQVMNRQSLEIKRHQSQSFRNLSQFVQKAKALEVTIPESIRFRTICVFR